MSHTFVTKRAKDPLPNPRRSLLRAFQWPWSNNLPPRASDAKTRPTPILAITTHVPILVHVPSLPWSNSLSCVSRSLCQMLLPFLPIALPFSLSFHFPFQKRLARPPTCFSLSLRFLAPLVLKIHFGGCRVVGWPVRYGLCGSRSRIARQETVCAIGAGIIGCWIG